jgi:hypothetical protein
MILKVLFFIHAERPYNADILLSVSLSRIRVDCNLYVFWRGNQKLDPKLDLLIAFFSPVLGELNLISQSNLAFFMCIRLKYSKLDREIR